MGHRPGRTRRDVAALVWSADQRAGGSAVGLPLGAGGWWVKGVVFRSAAGAESGGQHHPEDAESHPHQQHHHSCSKHHIHLWYFPESSCAWDLHVTALSLMPRWAVVGGWPVWVSLLAGG